MWRRKKNDSIKCIQTNEKNQWALASSSWWLLPCTVLSFVVRRFPFEIRDRKWFYAKSKCLHSHPVLYDYLNLFGHVAYGRASVYNVRVYTMPRFMCQRVENDWKCIFKWLSCLFRNVVPHSPHSLPATDATVAALMPLLLKIQFISFSLAAKWNENTREGNAQS